MLLSVLMARPYTDPVEIITEPIPAQSPFIPADAKIVVGAVAPASPDPIPIVLLPGFEYRMLEWRHPTTHEIHWRLERRKSTQRTAVITRRAFDTSEGLGSGAQRGRVLLPGSADQERVQHPCRGRQELLHVGTIGIVERLEDHREGEAPLVEGNLGQPVLSHRIPLLLSECHRSQRNDVLLFVVEVSLGYRVELVES